MNEKPLPVNEKPLSTGKEPIALKFRFDWKVTLLVLLLLPVTFSLGRWQLQRADEKQALIAEREAHQAIAPTPLNLLPKNPSELRYRQVALAGSFDSEHCFLLDNQVHLGRVGYEIICPFLNRVNVDQATVVQNTVLVSRGFVAAPPLRSQLPSIPAVSTPITTHGEVYLPAGEQVLLDELKAADGWPKVVQAASVDYLQTLLVASKDAPVFPWLVRLGVDSPALLESHWQVVNLSPEKHTGYAVQWFAMAATLVLIGVLANTTFAQWFKQRKRRD